MSQLKKHFYDVMNQNQNGHKYILQSNALRIHNDNQQDDEKNNIYDKDLQKSEEGEVGQKYNRTKHQCKIYILHDFIVFIMQIQYLQDKNRQNKCDENYSNA